MLVRLINSALLAAFFCSPAPAALVAHWAMNESAGDLLDSSGSGLTAAASASGLGYNQGSVGAGNYGNISLSASQAAAFGSAVHFDRASQGHATLSGQAPVIKGLAEAGPSGSFTVMAWINPESLPSGTTYRIFATGGGAGTGGWGAGVANVDRLRFTNFNVADFTSSGTPVTGGSWQHVAFTFADGTVSMFHNAQLVGSAPASSGFNEENVANAFVIGANTNGTTDSFNGLMDELRIYDSLLSEAEIISAATVPEPGFLGLMLMGGLGLLRRRR